MFVIVTIADDDRQRVGAARRGVSAVLHDDRQVVVFFMFPIKHPFRRDYSCALTVEAST